MRFLCSSIRIYNKRTIFIEFSFLIERDAVLNRLLCTSLISKDNKDFERVRIVYLSNRSDCFSR